MLCYKFLRWVDLSFPRELLPQKCYGLGKILLFNIEKHISCGASRNKYPAFLISFEIAFDIRHLFVEIVGSLRINCDLTMICRHHQQSLAGSAMHIFVKEFLHHLEEIVYLNFKLL